MFSFFKADPVKKLRKQQGIILEKAMHAQRNGDIRLYSQLTLDAENLDKKIQELSKSNAKK